MSDGEDDVDEVGFLEVSGGWQEAPWKEAVMFLQSLDDAVMGAQQTPLFKSIAEVGRNKSAIQPYDVEQVSITAYVLA